MALSASDRSALIRATTAGNSELAVPLTDEICKYLVAVLVRDLQLQSVLPEIPTDVPELFSVEAIQDSPAVVPGVFLNLMDRLVQHDRNTITYFICLAALHSRRLKFNRILQCQPIPTIEQVGPRGLVQFGTLPSPTLAALLFWRKWLYDIDNRAAQETGYVFEPVIASSLGGLSVGASRSPVRRRNDTTKGRQVDCVVDCPTRGKLAYEFKMRVTIAASGQGRWAEELEFPLDAVASGYRPILIVFDRTTNDKLTGLVDAFCSGNQGEAHVGPAAWAHLDQMAGPTMATFLEKYVRVPIQVLLEEAPKEASLPQITFKMTDDLFTVRVEGIEGVWEVIRTPRAEGASSGD